MKTFKYISVGIYFITFFICLFLKSSNNKILFDIILTIFWLSAIPVNIFLLSIFKKKSVVSEKLNEIEELKRNYIGELSKWTKKFPDVLYEELFRIYNLRNTDITKRPKFIGAWTNKYIYNELPTGVLNELKIRTPKSKNRKYILNFHQTLTIDLGEPNLNGQILKIITLLKVSDDKGQFKSLFNKIKSRESGQLEFTFIFDDKDDNEI